MNGRRLLAAAAAGVLVVLTVAPPAWAAQHPPPKVERTSPPTLDKQGPITGTITANEGQTLQGAEFTLTSEPGSSGPGGDRCLIDLPDQTYRDTTRETFSFDPTFLCNGAYKLVIKVFYENPGLIELAPRQPAETTVTLEFSVAIKPAQVKGLGASYDAATREVRLTWAPNPEPDTRYLVERSPAGQARFSPIGAGPVTGTEFTDPDIGDGQLYRVISVRPGPAGGEITGDPSVFVRSGPEAPRPTAPPPSQGNSGGGSRAGGNPSRGGARPQGQAPANNRFEQTLPFDPSQTTTTVTVPPQADETPEDAAVLAEFDDERSDTERRRATLVPVAGGLALLVGAMHLFLLSRRAGEMSDIPIVPR
ncbi:MAG: fibronectin type III domain-containing protein [Actinobacteria bacterium]|nr:fibronectin type III domain-containing protein [Actinomycetota bacterium]